MLHGYLSKDDGNGGVVFVFGYLDEFGFDGLASSTPGRVEFHDHQFVGVGLEPGA